MKHFSEKDLLLMDKIYRLNLINSSTGYKSANLIATLSQEKMTNVAVFSSVTHVGSNPPLLGFILRPTEVPRHTYNNLKDTGYFTVNHIHKSMIADAHHTSAAYPETISEFDQTQLQHEYRDDFWAPYVKDAKVQLGCEYINEFVIKENNCLFIIGAIKHLYIAEGIQQEDGFLNLENAATVAVNGLDGYSLPSLLDRFEYARPLKNTNDS